MAINYTSILGLPQITLEHDAAESVAAMAAMATTLDALNGDILCTDAEALVCDGEFLTKT